ncbi:unnamed protein product [Closterium sp. Yama58-4]|nr:unnamed protein product [Closterium sp. Yama58-4]
MLVKAFYQAEKPAVVAPSAGTCDDLECFDWCPSSPISALTQSLPSLFPPSSPYACISDAMEAMEEEKPSADFRSNDPLMSTSDGEVLLSQWDATPQDDARHLSTPVTSVSTRKRRLDAGGTNSGASSSDCCDGERCGVAAPTLRLPIQGAPPESCGACADCTEGANPRFSADNPIANDVERAPVAHPGDTSKGIAAIAATPGRPSSCRPRPLPASMRLTMADIKCVIGLKTAPPTKKPRKGEVAALATQPCSAGSKPRLEHMRAGSPHRAASPLPHPTRANLPHSRSSAGIAIPSDQVPLEPSRCLPDVSATPDRFGAPQLSSPAGSPPTASPLAETVVPCQCDGVDANGYSSLCSPCCCPPPDSMHGAPCMPPPATYLPSAIAASPFSAAAAATDPHWAGLGGKMGNSSSSPDLEAVLPPAAHQLPTMACASARFLHSPLLAPPQVAPYPHILGMGMGVDAGMMGCGFRVGAVGLECGGSEEEGCTCGGARTWDREELELGQTSGPWLSMPRAAANVELPPWLSTPAGHVHPLHWQRNQLQQQQEVDAYSVPFPIVDRAMPWEANEHAGVAGPSTGGLLWQHKDGGAAEFTKRTALSPVDKFAARDGDTEVGQDAPHQVTELKQGTKGDHASSGDEKEVKRKESNRESARRSRMRRQDMMDRLHEETSQLRQTNRSVLEQASRTEEQLKALKAVHQRLKDECEEVRKQIAAAGVVQKEA